MRRKAKRETSEVSREALAQERIAEAQRKRLRHLDLSGLGLSRIPEAVWDLSGLNVLDLHDNQLSSVSEDVGLLTELMVLDLRQNRLSRLPEAFGHLARLTKLSLCNNQLTFLPDTLGNLTRLTELHLHGNDRLDLPDEVLGPTQTAVAGGKAPADPIAILAYYFRTRAGARPLNEAKLILVGRGEVGKTCLVNQLVSSKFVDTSKTAGIQITDLDLPFRPDPVQLHLWDFGGQEIMHATHRFFLTERSLYLLVLNGREGGEDYDVEYWLKLISSFGGDSPVIVVLNKIAEHPFDLNYRAVQEKYPQVRGFVKTDCREPVGIEELRAAITAAIGSMPDVKASFPTAWFAIKDKLAHMGESLNWNYIAYDRYQELCNDLGEPDPTAQNQLAGFLHCLGVALNYRDDPRLREMSILNPRWVTDGIYRLLNAPALASTKGVLTLADLGKLLPTEDYPVEKHAFLLELMRKFKLCFAFPDEQGGRYLVPELLDKQEPDLGTEFDPRSCLNFEYSYDIQPEGLLPGFIVRSNVLSEGQPRWRSGVVLEWGGCRALVRADVAASRITIHVRGGEAAERRELLAVIRSDFERMHREIIALQVTALVPVPDHPQTRVEYDRLVAFEREGYDQHRELIDGKVFTLSVKQLLGGVDLAPPPARGAARTGKDEALKLFISYSHKDEAFRERLEVHLKLLERTEKIAPWHDRRLLPGDDWKGQIDRNMETADIILLLVSADFIASDYCYDTEMDCMLKRASAGESRIVPIIVNDCDWTTAPFARVQALPSGARPVAVWSNAESAWTDVAKGIRSVINDIRRVAPPWSEQRLMLRSVELVNICCFGQSRLDLATEGSPCQFGLVFGPNSIGKTTLLRSIAIGLCDPPNAERLISMMPGDLMRSGEGEGLIALELTDSEGQQGWRLETHISRTSDGQLDVRFAGAPELDRSRLFVCGYGAARHGLGTQDFTAYSHHLAVNTLFDYGAPLQNPELALRRAQDNGGDTTRLLSQIDSVLMLEPRATSLGPNGITVSGPWGDGMPRTALGDGYQATLAWLADMLGWAACHAPEALADQLAGIVLIDELEQHLHPAWQRELVLLLSTHFPKVQFIAASHAPLCAVGMTALPDSSGRIFTVRQDETGAKVETFGLPRGQRADQVLTSPIFGLFSASDFGIEADIDRYIQLSSESGRTDAEDEEMAKLEQRLYRIMGPFQTELDIELERAVQDVLRSRVALELEKGALSETGLNLKVRRRLQDLFGAEVHNGKDRLS